MSPPPPPLMEELVEEILLRLPAQEPASLARAALVCKPWRRLVSGARFRRRFLEFHRTHPMLGFFCNHHCDGYSFERTVTVAASSSPLHATKPYCIALDARHGRVLLRDYTGSRNRNVLVLVVWDPITDERRRLPIPPRPAITCTAAVICTSAGDCNHSDCRRGPFLVVLVGTDPGNMFLCTYSSDAAAWSEPIPTQRPNRCYNQAGYSPSVLLGDALYFGIPASSAALKYNLELRQISWLGLPLLRNFLQRSVLTATDHGGLGLVTIGDSDGASKLCVWFKPANAGWTQRKAIDIWRLLPVDSHYCTVVGFADALRIVFVRVDVIGALYTIDLKTHMVKEVYRGTGVRTVFPYMSFCLPGINRMKSKVL